MTEIVERPHAYYGASGSKIWLQCTAAVPLWRDLERMGWAEQEASDYAQLGTHAHTVAEHALAQLGGVEGQDPAVMYARGVNFLIESDRQRRRLAVAYAAGDLANREGVELPEDVIEAVSLHVELVCELCGCWEPVQVQLENRFRLTQLYDAYSGTISTAEAERSHLALYGTADVVLVCDDRLIVVDYKNGAGVPQPAHDNPQLKYYALGAYLAQSKQVRQNMQVVEWYVTQPRLPGASGEDGTFFTRDSCEIDELLAFGQTIVDAVEESEGVGGQPEFRPGDHCRWCKAAGRCPALAERAHTRAKEVFADLPPDATKEAVAERVQHALKAIDDTQLGALLTDIELVEVLAREAKDAALRRGLAGAKVPGFRVVEGRTQKAWTNETTAVLTLNNVLTGSNKVTRAELFKPRSPTAVGKVLDLEAHPEVADLITKPDPKPALAREDDKRRTWEPFRLASNRFADTPVE